MAEWLRNFYDSTEPLPEDFLSDRSNAVLPGTSETETLE